MTEVLFVNGSRTLELLEFEAIGTTLSQGLKAKVSRDMLSLSHGLFLQRLVENAQSKMSP